MKNYKLIIPSINAFDKVFRPYQIMEKAEQVGFVKRSDGKLEPMTFVKALTIGIFNQSKTTLEHIICKCEEIQNKLKITKQAIHQRLETGAKLLKELFDESLEYALEKIHKVDTANVLKQFKNVYICDSTLLEVPKKLIEIYPSSGGNNQKGSIRLQAVFSVINKTFKKLEFFKGTNNDQEYAYQIADMIEQGELVIFDLGYFGKKVLNKIISKDAYFISRIAHNNSFYLENVNKDGQVNKIDILEILKKSNGVVDIEIIVGSNPKERLKCRLVATRLPDNIVNERRRKARIKNKGKNLTSFHMEFLAWNVMITNVPVEDLSVEAIFDMYRIRWQIEIIFKSLKSNLNLDNLGSGGKAQTECILYGKLIAIILFTMVYSNMYALMYSLRNRELSILKFFDLIKIKYSSIFQCIIPKIVSFEALSNILFYVAEKSLYEKRARKSTLQLIMEYPVSLLTKTG